MFVTFTFQTTSFEVELTVHPGSQDPKTELLGA